MAIGIRKTPHQSETRFYIARMNKGIFHIWNITPTKSSLARFSKLVKSNKYELFRCKTHNVVLEVVIQ